MCCDGGAIGVRCRSLIVGAMGNAEPDLTGWERHVHVGDTMLRRYLFHRAALDAAFTLAVGGHALDTDDVSLADASRPGGCFNGAVLLRPPTDWSSLVARIERFASGGRGQLCLWSAWPTPDLGDRGWRLVGHPPLHLRPPLSTAPVQGPAPTNVDVRPVTSAPDLAAWERVAIDGYPLPGLCGAPVGAFVSPSLLDDDRLRFFTGGADDGPVAAAASFTSHGIASLAFETTSPIAPHPGLWRRMAVARLEAAPDVWTAGVFGDQHRPSAEELGFVPLVRLTLWILDRS
jgi:hypothetical protein